MKKIFILIFLSVFMFANNNDINQKLNLILNKLNQLEKKLNEKDKEIEKLKNELKLQQKTLKKQEINTKKELALTSCDKLIVTNFNYEYHDDVLPYITFSVTIKNNYPYDVVKLYGNLYFDDKDGTTIIKHFVDRKVLIKAGKSITIKGQHMTLDDIEKLIKNENKKDLKVYFSPLEIDFKNSKEIKCY